MFCLSWNLEISKSWKNIIFDLHLEIPGADSEILKRYLVNVMLLFINNHSFDSLRF